MPNCISGDKQSQSREEVVKDVLAHTVPGGLVIASMVAVIALLTDGRSLHLHHVLL